MLRIFPAVENRGITADGVYNEGDPPLSIPNRAVKSLSADGTAEMWESRSMPNLIGREYFSFREMLPFLLLGVKIFVDASLECGFCCNFV